MTLKKRLQIGAASLVCLAALSTAAAAATPHALSPDDAEHYVAAFQDVDRGDFIDAQMQVADIQDKSLVGYLSFHQLMHPSAHKASFDELCGWLKSFRDLPLADRIFNLAAKRKPSDAADDPAPPELSSDEIARAQLPATDKGRAAREAFYSGDARRALELAPAAGERWVAGLAAFRLGSYDQAKGFFADLAADAAEDPWLRAGAGYWAARAASALGDSPTAWSYLRLAAREPTTFYGMIAERQVRLQAALAQANTADTGRIIKASWSSGPAVIRQADTSQAAADPELARFADRNARAHRAAALVQLGRVDEARQELKAGLALARSDKERASWTGLIAALGASPDRPSSQPQRRSAAGPSEYPTPELSPTGGYTIDKALVYAISYQESRFNPVAISPVGAIGMMQLMPESAARAAGDDSLKKDPAPLFDAAYNLRVGQDYVTWLMQHGVGYDILRTVAAYNGGPGAVLKTIDKLNGAASDPLMLIECLPAQETRSYVERVMAAYWTYRRMWGQDTPTLDAVAQGARLIDARLDLTQPDPIGSLLAAQGRQSGLP
jgi:soluble lytic murein transglycosylase-like protein